MAYIPVPPSQWRLFLVEMYRIGRASWDETFRELFNAGWRGPMDRDGFPTRRS